MKYINIILIIAILILLVLNLIVFDIQYQLHKQNSKVSRISVNGMKVPISYIKENPVVSIDKLRKDFPK